MSVKSSSFLVAFLSAFVAAVVVARGGCSGGSPERMNVLLITLDTTRADFLSCYGYPEPTTPNLDALAAEGTRFDLAMATASVTPVSHSSILTGRFNRDHGLRVISALSGFRLSEDVPTLTTELKAAGWSTAAVHSAFPVSGYFGFANGFDRFESFDGELRNMGDMKSGWDQRMTRRSDKTTEIVTRTLGDVADPFFLWIHYWDPHDWNDIPPKEYMPPPEKLYQLEEDGTFKLDEEGRKLPQRPALDLYAAEIRYMDAQIGRVIENLKASGRYDDTIVVVVADHGQGLGDHGWAAHRILFQEQIRVPLIVRIPGVDQKEAVEELVRTVDILPTVLDYLGMPEPEGVSGRTLRPLMEGGVDEPRLHFAEQINGYDLNAGMVAKRPLDDYMYLAMDREWKLVYRPNHPDESELFNLLRDPKEMENLYAQERDVVVRLKKELAIRSPWVTEPFPDKGEVDPNALGALAELGYMSGEENGEPPQWDWVCPEHDDQVSSTQTRCPVCQSAPVLIRKR